MGNTPDRREEKNEPQSHREHRGKRHREIQLEILLIAILCVFFLCVLCDSVVRFLHDTNSENTSTDCTNHCFNVGSLTIPFCTASVSAAGFSGTGTAEYSNKSHSSIRWPRRVGADRRGTKPIDHARRMPWAYSWNTSSANGTPLANCVSATMRSACTSRLLHTPIGGSERWCAHSTTGFFKNSSRLRSPAATTTSPARSGSDVLMTLRR